MDSLYLVFVFWTVCKEFVRVELKNYDELVNEYNYKNEDVKNVKQGEDEGMTYRFIKCENYKDAMATLALGALEFYPLDSDD